MTGSPSHCKTTIDDRECHEIEIPTDVMSSLVPGLERLVAENRITMDAANQIVLTCKVPIELAQHLGLLAHSGGHGMDVYSTHPHLQSHSVSPTPLGYNKYHCYSSNGGFIIPSGTMSPNLSSQFNSQNIPPSFASNASPVYSSFSGSSSPNPYYNAGGSSPMHQITKGISGLSAGGGSITRGTSAAFESANQPLDLTMDVVTNTENPFYSAGTSWYVPAQFYDLKPLNLLPAAQQVRIVPTPPASPNLCIIQEENSLQHPSISYQSSSFMANDEFPHSHPQICVTDVQGDEFTLVDHGNSKDSDDSLDGQSSITLQGLIISEPSSDMPSITRGVGRKSSLEIEHKQQEHVYERRGSDRSDKSLGFSDDSLSNDSNILSPGQEPSASSGFKSCDSHSDHTESRLSPDSLSESRMSDEYYELPLPTECSNLDSVRILEIVKQTIDSKMPPKGFVLNRVDNDSGEMSMSVDISNLSLEYSGGLQIELQVCDGRSKNNACSKGIKLRRISGDQFEYGKLCQQLISSLTV